MSKARAKVGLSRAEMVRLLVLDSVEHNGDFKRYLWLQNMLEGGFAGYAAMSNQELLKEMRWRGLTIDISHEEERYETEDDHLEIQGVLQDRRWTSIAYD